MIWLGWKNIMITVCDYRLIQSYCNSTALPTVILPNFKWPLIQNLFTKISDAVCCMGSAIKWFIYSQISTSGSYSRTLMVDFVPHFPPTYEMQPANFSCNYLDEAYFGTERNNSSPGTVGMTNWSQHSVHTIRVQFVGWDTKVNARVTGKSTFLYNH